MPSPRNNRKGAVEEKKGKSVYRTSSFHGHDSSTVVEMMRRPRTVPNLVALSVEGFGGVVKEVRGIQEPKKLPKLLLNVTIQRSVGHVHVVMLPDSTVGEFITAAVRLYVKEGRRPILTSVDPEGFDLHYSQFSLESLNREEKLMTLGSRNFFLCPRKGSVAENSGIEAYSCSKEVEKATKPGLPWLKFMDLLL